jgi:hypothetical protein
MRLALAVLVLLAAGPAAAAHPVRDVDLPSVFAGEIQRAQTRTVVPILLPQTLHSSFRRHHPDGTAGPRGWRFELGAVRGCHTATACFIAEFRGRADGRPGNPRALRLARGRTGWFQPLSCGASCSPPSIEWHERRTLFSIQAKVGTRTTERRMLVRMANSAIRHGPR